MGAIYAGEAAAGHLDYRGSAVPILTVPGMGFASGFAKLHDSQASHGPRLSLTVLVATTSLLPLPASSHQYALSTLSQFISIGRGRLDMLV